MNRIICVVFCCICLLSNSFAQEQQTGLYSAEMQAQAEQENNAQNEIIKKLQNLQISGFIQTQYQWGEEDALLLVGAPNESPDNSFNRIGIRRGRIKITYEEKIASGVFQFDMTEKGFGVRDAYLHIKNPWEKAITLKAGLFIRPFGNELSHSSPQLESPERSGIIRTLFPEDRDLGVAFAIKPSKNSQIHFLQLEAGLFAGNGIKQEIDSRKDFIGHLSAFKKIKSIELGGGISYYNGSVFQGSENIYRIKGDEFVLNNSADNKGKFAKREYFGFDGQLGLKTGIGTTQLRIEYLFGKQPGAGESSKSPNESSLPVHDTFIRNFSGGYIIFVQGLGSLPLSAVLKYDWYDPNTKVSGNSIGQHNTTKGDIARNTFGFGMLWQINTNLRLQAYYEINKNEKSENLADYNEDMKDNVFTLRMQYKF